MKINAKNVNIMKTKIKVFKNQNSEALAKAINEDKKEFFASQIFKTDKSWVCFAYYKE